MNTFSGKVALIAGASRGIGAATAQAFGRAGAAVVLAARDLAALEAVAEAIISAGGKAVAVRTDVRDPESVEHLVDVATDRFGRLDIAFNNATDGYQPTPIADTDAEDFARAIQGNLHGTFLGMKYQIPAILAGGGGAIVNMASLAGLRGVADIAGYTAGKAGVIGLTKVAALEYADRGIRVNALAPGPILTHHLERAGKKAQEHAAAAVPMGRIGRVDEVAATVLWLSSEESSFITGATIPVDGGQHAGTKPARTYRPGEPMSP